MGLESGEIVIFSSSLDSSSEWKEELTIDSQYVTTSIISLISKLKARLVLDTRISIRFTV